MVPIDKVKVLSELSSFDMEQEESIKHIPLGQKGNSLPLYEAKTPRGKCTLFKTLMTNKCKMDCRYCINSKCSKKQKEFSYTPQELAEVFSTLYRRRAVQGLFLSSSIIDPIDSMEKIIEAAQILRIKKSYKGYMHLKILPGSSPDQVKRAMGFANRVSVNLETVSPSHLSEIASNKDFKNDILKRQAWIRNLQSRFRSPHPLDASHGPRGVPPHSCPGSMHFCGPRGVSHTSQVMVGVNGETDRDIFSLAASVYDHMNLTRMYYSAFKPIADTPLEGSLPTPLWRQNRLYQLDWLYRVYEYSRDEIQSAFQNDLLGNLDPKLAIARTTFERPLEVNGAEERDLLRVPGIGPKTAKSLAKAKEKLTSMVDLRKHGVIVKRAIPFLKLNGFHQTTISAFN